MTLIEKIEDVLYEAITPEERAKAVAYTKKLKKVLNKDIGKVKVEVGKSKRPNPFIRVFGDIPNDFRVKVVKALGITGVLDMKNVDYGNIRANGVTLSYSDWIKVMGELN